MAPKCLRPCLSRYGDPAPLCKGPALCPAHPYFLKHNHAASLPVLTEPFGCKAKCKQTHDATADLTDGDDDDDDDDDDDAGDR